MIKNFYEIEGEHKRIHEGQGLVDSRKIFGASDCESKLRYVAFTKIPPGATIGFHEHNNLREEVYVILEGQGTMDIDNTKTHVKKGDTILTPIGAKHGLYNTGSLELEVFVFWIEK